MKNGLDANIKSMSQAQKTLLRYQYVMANTSKVQGDFARTSDTWHNQIVILKQQLQQLATVIGSGLIQAIKPFVKQMNSVLSSLITFAQNVVNALGKIFGWEMDVNTKGLTIDDDAIDDAEDLSNNLDDTADSANDTAKAVKKLNDQLQGFDKLNVLRTTEKNSTSKKKKDDDTTNALGDIANADDVSAALKKTKGAFESEIDNLYGLGQYIADKIKKALKDIKWKDVYSAAEKWGEGLANFLNGIVDDKELFSEIGKTVANGINTALTFLDSFGKTFHWDNFGASLAASLTSFLKNIKWEKALSAAKNWGSGIGTAIASFIKENDFKEVGKAIAMAIKTVLTFWLSLGSEIPWKDLGQKLADTINSAIKNFPAKDFADTIDVWVQGIFDLLVAALTNIHWDELAGKIAEFLGALDIKTVAIIIGGILLKKAAGFAISIGGGILSSVITTLSTTLSGVIGPIFSGLAGLASTLAPILVAIGGIALAIKGFFDIWTKGWSVARQLMVVVGSGIAIAIGVIAGVLTGPLALAIAGAVAAFSFFAANHETIVKGIKEKWNELKTSAATFVDDFKAIPGDLKEYVWDPLVADVKSAVDGIGKWFGGLPDKFEALNNNIGKKVGEIKTSLGTKWDEIKTTVGKKVDAIKTEAGNKWDAVRTTVGDKINTIKTNASNGWETIKTTVGGKMETLKTNLGTAWDTIKTVAGNKIGGSGGIAGSVQEKFSSIVTNVSKLFGDNKGLIGAIKDKFDWMIKNFPTLGWNAGVEIYNGLKKAIKKIVNDLFPIKIGNWMSIPKIKLNTSTATILGRTFTYPTGFSFYKKAYDNPFLFTKPTLIPTMNGFKGFGDGNGGEMVYGHANLMNDIREASGNSDMTAIGNRQLANDQRIIQLLSIIAQKEFGVSSDTLFRSVRDQAQNYTNRTGRQAFEF